MRWNFHQPFFIFCMVCKMGIAIICLPVFKRWAIIYINSCRMAHQWIGLLTRKTIRKGFFTSLVEMLVRTGLLCSRWLVVSVSTVALPYSLGNEILYIFKRGRTINFCPSSHPNHKKIFCGCLIYVSKPIKNIFLMICYGTLSDTSCITYNFINASATLYNYIDWLINWLWFITVDSFKIVVRFC